MTTKYLIFEESDTPAHIKTKRWIVRHKKSGTQLGEIEWYRYWRQYCYFTDCDAVYNKTCLRDIADFMEKQMEERKGRNGKE